MPPVVTFKSPFESALTSSSSSSSATATVANQPAKSQGVTKRVYVGIKGRHKRSHGSYSDSNSQIEFPDSGHSMASKPFIESLADTFREGSGFGMDMNMGGGGVITATSGRKGRGGIHHVPHGVYMGASHSHGGHGMNGSMNIPMMSSIDIDASSSSGMGRMSAAHPGDQYMIHDSYLRHPDDNNVLGNEDCDEDYEPDWRDQIYYWTGLLSFDTEKSCLVWKGTWLGSFTGKPSPEEFAWSNNEFEYSGERLSLDDLYSQGLLRPKSGYFKGFYLMDSDGSGSLEKYLDNEYYVEFEEVRGLHPPRYTVIGKGESDFGTFVLTGTYNAGNRVLEMARQYIAEDDERCHMDINQIKQHLIAAAARLS